MVPEQTKGATKDMRVTNSVDPCVLKSNFLDLDYIVPLQLPVTSRQQENVAVISSNITCNSIFI